MTLTLKKKTNLPLIKLNKCTTLQNPRKIRPKGRMKAFTAFSFALFTHSDIVKNQKGFSNCPHEGKNI
jgi:hypothetical protein